MPWIDSKKITPPMNVDVMIRNDDGTATIRKLEDVEIYDGIGGHCKTMPRYWQQPNGDANAPIPAGSIGVDGISCQDQHVEIKPEFNKERM